MGNTNLVIIELFSLERLLICYIVFINKLLKGKLMQSNFETKILFSSFFKMSFGVSALSKVLLFPLSVLKYAQQCHHL